MLMGKQISIIVAVDLDGGFGKEGKIPWYFPEDFKHFQKITKGNACVMGRKTYEDMFTMISNRKKIAKYSHIENTEIDFPQNLLPERETFVISRNTQLVPAGSKRVRNIRQAIQDMNPKYDTLFVLGGEKLFIEAMAIVDTVYMTIIQNRYSCDRFFPLKTLTRKFQITDGHKSNDLIFLTYKRTKK